MYAPVFYPSMQEIWPALYSTNNIRVVEVSVSGLEGTGCLRRKLVFRSVCEYFISCPCLEGFWRWQQPSPRLLRCLVVRHVKPRCMVERTRT